MRGWGNGLGADLSEESDWLLAHGMSVTNVGLDDFSKGLLHSLQDINTTYRNYYSSEEQEKSVKDERIYSLCTQDIMSL